MLVTQKYIYNWLWIGIGFICVMLMVGGITRLSGSGLSITEWNLIIGIIPPLNQNEWELAFNKYKLIPQFEQINSHLDLNGFKFIFFWEYLHRLLGRILSLVFIFPFLYFWYKNYLNSTLRKRLLFLFFLGALQGGMGWFMVKSGLSELTFVSHYRLAAHLLLAFLLLFVCVWIAESLKKTNLKSLSNDHKRLKLAVLVFGVLLCIQLVWGAFTAGLHAGLQYKTFPLMNGNWFPSHAFYLEPVWLNIFENAGLVQWIHRVIGIVLLIYSAVLLLIHLKNFDLREYLSISSQLFLAIVLQVLLGILTLIYSVPLPLAVFHQLLAAITFILWTKSFHQIYFDTHYYYNKPLNE